VQAMTDARVRLYGPQAAESPPDIGPTADEVSTNSRRSPTKALPRWRRASE